MNIFQWPIVMHKFMTTADVAPTQQFNMSTTQEGTLCNEWIRSSVSRACLDTETRRKILCLCQGSNCGHPVHNQDTILTELQWLHKLYYTEHKLIKIWNVRYCVTIVFVSGVYEWWFTNEYLCPMHISTKLLIQI